MGYHFITHSAHFIGCSHNCYDHYSLTDSKPIILYFTLHIVKSAKRKCLNSREFRHFLLIFTGNMCYFYFILSYIFTFILLNNTNQVLTYRHDIRFHAGNVCGSCHNMSPNRSCNINYKLRQRKIRRFINHEKNNQLYQAR